MLKIHSACISIISVDCKCINGDELFILYFTNNILFIFLVSKQQLLFIEFKK